MTRHLPEITFPFVLRCAEIVLCTGMTVASFVIMSNALSGEYDVAGRAIDPPNELYVQSVAALVSSLTVAGWTALGHCRRGIPNSPTASAAFARASLIFDLLWSLVFLTLAIVGTQYFDQQGGDSDVQASSDGLNGQIAARLSALSLLTFVSTFAFLCSAICSFRRYQVARRQINLFLEKGLGTPDGGYYIDGMAVVAVGHQQQQRREEEEAPEKEEEEEEPEGQRAAPTRIMAEAPGTKEIV